ncbi:hypothetical protein TURU_138033 [Turdus rufiventris]|nr:hypothetical protein TURU_138033 [Turdus rufiventris]
MALAPWPHLPMLAMVPLALPVPIGCSRVGSGATAPPTRASCSPASPSATALPAPARFSLHAGSILLDLTASASLKVMKVNEDPINTK